MKNVFKFLLLAVFFMFACSESTSNNDDEVTGPTGPVDPFEQNELLAKTLNIGNAYEDGNAGDWVEQGFFKIIADAGFTAIRLPIRWSSHTAVDSPYTIDASFMIKIEWAVTQARINGLATIIDVHHFDEIFSNPYQEKGKFLAIWRQISENFLDHPTNVFYEILNEPHDRLTATIWNEFLSDAIETIRYVDTLHTVIIGTAEWGGLSAMDKLVLPEDEDNLIFTIHYYSPFEFTHQGAEWVDGSDDWLGTTWGSTSDNIALTPDFELVKDWAEDKNVPVFIGEFGSYNKANMDSRVRWTNAVARKAELYGFSWGYWEFASGFGIYDLNTKTWREPLLSSLIID